MTPADRAKRRYREAHRDRCRDSQNRYRRANVEKCRASSRRWAMKNRKVNQERVRAANRRYAHKMNLAKHGLTPEDYERMWKNQSGACAICSGKGNHKRLAVDHSHKTGRVRALLCQRCNLTLGQLDDSTELCDAMKNYLCRHQQTP